MINAKDYSQILSELNTNLISSDDYNPDTHNLRYYNDNLLEPIHHEYSHKFLLRYAHHLMRFRYNYPNLSLFLSYAVPALFIASIPFVWAFLPSLIAVSVGSLFLIQIATTIVSAIGLIMAGLSIWSAKNVLGDPIKPGESIYQKEVSYDYMNSKGKITLEPGKLPKLTITAENHQKAGYIEGYLQGEQIEQVLAGLDNLYRNPNNGFRSLKKLL